MRVRRVLTICLTLAIGVIAPGGWRAVQSAQSGGTSRVERWPSLGIDVNELVLDNGFRILLVEDHHVPRVAASLWYRFGGLQEQNGEHGAAHFLEHAMHQGTTTVGIRDWEADRKSWSEIWTTEQQLLAERNAHRNLLRERNIFFNEGDWPATEEETRLRRRLYDLEDQQAKNRVFWEEYNWYRRSGGIMRHGDPVPANTGNELLRIEVDLPKERLEMFFRLEADRMVNAVFRGWEAQRFTVLEQFYVLQRHETGRFAEALNNVTGGPHPIFNHPGGHQRDFAYFNRASMLRMYEDFIVPNNATLVLVGDMTIDQVKPIAAKYFGRLARAPEPPARMDVEVDPPPGGSVRFDWLEPLEPQVTVRYRIPGVGHRDRPAFDVIARVLRGPDGVLAQAQSGRGGGEWSANASQNGSPNTLSMQSSAARDEDLPALETVAADAVERLRRGAVDEANLARMKRELRLDWEIVRSDRGSLASQIGGFAVADDWRTLKTYYDARDAVTVADIRRLSEKYLVPWNRVTATTRRNPQPRAEGTTTSAAASERPQGGAR
jgi:predicted Zn-dependent peptidase